MKRVCKNEIINGKVRKSISREYSRDKFKVLVNNIFMNFQKRYHGFGTTGSAAFLGCEPIDLIIKFSRAYPDMNLICMDGSLDTLRFANEKVFELGLSKKIKLYFGEIPKSILPPSEYNLILSNNLLHKIGHPSIFWSYIKNIGKKNSIVYISDFCRPNNKNLAKKLAEEQSIEKITAFKRHIYSSVLASYTIKEAESQLEKFNLNLNVEKIRYKRMIIHGKL